MKRVYQNRGGLTQRQGKPERGVSGRSRKTETLLPGDRVQRDGPRQECNRLSSRRYGQPVKNTVRKSKKS